MNLNIRYNSGKIWYKCITNDDGTKSLVKENEGSLTSVVKGDGTKVTITGTEAKVEVDLSGDTTQAAQFDASKKLLVKKIVVDQDSANLAEFQDIAGGGQKLVIKRSGRRGKYVRTALATIEDYFASSEYVVDATATDPAVKFALIPGDTLIFVNSMDPAAAGYNQMRFSYENIANANSITDFIEKEKDAVDTPYTSDSTVVTLNPITRKINHNFSTAIYNALKVNATSGAAEVIVGTATIHRTTPSTGAVSDITVEGYLDLLAIENESEQQRLTALESDVTALKQRTYTQGTTLDGTQVKIGGDVSETRTTTVQNGGNMNYNASVAGVGTMMSIQSDRIVFGKNSVNVVGKPRFWFDPTTSLYFGIDFDVKTGAEYLVQSHQGVPNL